MRPQFLLENSKRSLFEGFPTNQNYLIIFSFLIINGRHLMLFCFAETFTTFLCPTLTTIRADNHNWRSDLNLKLIHSYCFRKVDSPTGNKSSRQAPSNRNFSVTG